MEEWPHKDPDEIIDYGINWEKDLQSDSIITSTWITPVGLTVDSDSVINKTTIIWLSGGVLGSTYELTNRITTSDGRTMDKTVRLRIMHR
jgi:hypothetical protein